MQHLFFPAARLGNQLEHDPSAVLTAPRPYPIEVAAEKDRGGDGIRSILVVETIKHSFIPVPSRAG